MESAAWGHAALPVALSIGGIFQTLYDLTNTSYGAAFRLVHGMALHLEGCGDGLGGFAVERDALENPLGAVGDGIVGKELAKGEREDRLAPGLVLGWCGVLLAGQPVDELGAAAN